MVNEMEELQFVNLTTNHMVYTLDTFSSIQNKQRADIQEKIQDCSAKCRTRFKEGIQTILEALRKKINDQTETDEQETKDPNNPQTTEKSLAPSDPVYEQLGFKSSLSFGPRCNLR